MNEQFKTMVKFGVTFPKKDVKMPLKWQKLTESRYKNEENYAILTGKTNNIIVVDLDNKDEEFVGLKWFEKHFGKIENVNTLTTKSINNGYHIYFEYEETKNINNTEYHIDILNKCKCVYEGKGYTIINENKIRKLTKKEVEAIKTLSIKKTEKTKDKIIELIKSNEIVSYKKANDLCKTPEETTWTIEPSSKGYKATPNCKQCLIYPRVEHSHNNHSALFINDDKTVVKTCFRCGTETLDKFEGKKIINVFNVILNIVNPENSLYEVLMNSVLQDGEKNKYKREKNTGVVYKKIKSYAYERYKNPQDYLNEIFFGDQEFKKDVHNMDNLIKFMKQYDDPKFSFIEVNEDYLGFSNGVFNIKTCEFTELPQEDLIVKKYFNTEFTKSKDTPLMDKVLDYQFSKEVRDFIYACLGRLFGIRDNFGVMLYLLGEPNCGKSVIIDVMSACFDKIGSIGDNFELKFGLSYLYDQDIVICDDLPKNISKAFPQQAFQSCVTLGQIPISVKRGDAFTIRWKVPMLLAGNWFPDYLDKGQISRRILTAHFENIVENVDVSLTSKIIQNELPALIYKSLLGYKKLLENETNGIWDLCPAYFKEQQEDLKMQRNPLFRFLMEKTRYKEGNSILMSELTSRFNMTLSDGKVKNLDNGTFSQVNKKYKIETIHVCKHCWKKAMKGCCVEYKSNERINRKVVYNIEMIEENNIIS